MPGKNFDFVHSDAKEIYMGQTARVFSLSSDL